MLRNTRNFRTLRESRIESLPAEVTGRGAQELAHRASRREFAKRLLSGDVPEPPTRFPRVPRSRARITLPSVRMPE